MEQFPEPSPSGGISERLTKNKFAKSLYYLANVLALAGTVEFGRMVLGQGDGPTSYAKSGGIEAIAQSHEDRIAQLRTVLGDREVDRILNLEPGEIPEGGTLLRHAERAGIGEAGMREYLAKALPASFADNIKTIDFVTPEGQKELGHGTEAAATTFAEFRNITVKVPEHADAVDMDFLFMHALPHEAAHLNDWRTNKHLTPEDRVALCAATLQRIHAPDRLRTAYLELLEKDPNITDMTMAVEYYAEAVSVYLDNPLSMSAADHELIKGVLAKTDPGTDRAAADRMIKDRYAVATSAHAPTPTP